jgi:integrase
VNRTIDSALKQAKKTRKRHAQQQVSSLNDHEGQHRRKQKEDSLRVWGPYADRTKFRLKIAEKGVERSLLFESWEEAERVKEELLQKYTQAMRKTVGEALKEWIREFSPVLKGSTISTYHKMIVLLPQTQVVSQLTARTAERLYLDQVERISEHTGRKLSTATQHLYLCVMRRFWLWLIEKGYAQTNPWMSVRKVGRANVGKPQLRIDETRKLEAVAMQRAQSGDVPALGILLMLYLGLRQGEVAARVARDVDDEGRVLWIPSGKTKNARRRLKIPEQLRSLILKRVEGMQPDERILYPSSHKMHHRNYYVAQLARLCRLAGVPVVCPHSLRGMHATLALEGGATGDAVAKALGHGSFEMTKTHYASASSVSNSESSRVAAVLGRESNRPDIELDGLLNRLGIDELESLLNKLRSRCGSSSSSDEMRST